MRTLGNILWHFPFLGFVSAFFVFLTGLLLTLLIVTAPIGTGLMQYARFLLAPYTNAMVSKDDLRVAQNPLWKAYSTIIMILYLPIGLVLAIMQIFQIVGLFCSIVGIPVALPLARSLGTVFNPVGKVCVPRAVEAALEARRGREDIERYMDR